jgi:B12-binding domain/radical SAM domain protein
LPGSPGVRHGAQSDSARHDGGHIPAGGVHRPAEQVSPALQRVPQAPQLLVSVCVLTHEPPHEVVPDAQAQRPPEQPVPELHGLLQRPQWSALVLVSVSQPLDALLSQLSRGAVHVSPGVSGTLWSGKLRSLTVRSGKPVASGSTVASSPAQSQAPKVPSSRQVCVLDAPLAQVQASVVPTVQPVGEGPPEPPPRAPPHEARSAKARAKLRVRIMAATIRRLAAACHGGDSLTKRPPADDLPRPMTPAPGRCVFVVHHARTGAAALNVVSAALDADFRTRDTDVLFCRDVAELTAAIRDVDRAGARPVVGWSFYSTDFPAMADDLARVRAATADVTRAVHLAGGVHATAEPLDTLRAGFDLVALGEGEATIVEVMHALTTGADPRALPGTAHRDEGSRLVSHGPAARHPLDDFPGFNARYFKWNPLEITRGCVYACTFCQTPYVFKARFRHRSVDNVREHAAAMARHEARYMRFVTPTALSYGSDDETPNLAAVEALLAAVRGALGREAKVYFGTFPSECRPEHVTEEALRIVARYCDNTSLIIGGQSGSERLLEATRRGHTVGDVVRAVERCVAAHLRPDVDFLFGLPGETEDDQRATVALAERLVAMGARVHSHGFMPLPGTPLRDAEPAPIGEELHAMLRRLEAQGKSYGPWRSHVVRADDLVRRRKSLRALGRR